ncbi:nuclease associated modular domain 3 protein [Vibrio phage 1.244.A._10N.261.54.C3]|nr:nuclease associated modular domain 3 protein [Vibrio phage 1.244.A._10N.261.54.C3]AUR98641.1 nuclease associated modular domain 3 protein [Vibrio phage 1.255.O._10N.286.45.F1]
MNYQAHYDNLITRSLNRTLPEGTYTEKHHILPRCMGGSDDKSNLVALTAREHFIAHLLLAKANPEHTKLWTAVQVMMVSTRDQKRATNSRSFSWLRERYAAAARENSPYYTERRSEIVAKLSENTKGKNNPMYGLKGDNNPNTGRKNTERTKKLMSLNAGSRGQKPWMNPKTISNVEVMIRWSLAEVLFGEWVYSGKTIGPVKMAKFVGDDYIESSTYKNISKLFKEGWIPSEDPSWLETFNK